MGIYNDKTWTDRVVATPNKRTLTYEDTTTQSVTVEKDEGAVATEGYAWSAENMNDMEARIELLSRLLEENINCAPIVVGYDAGVAVIKTNKTALKIRMTAGLMDFSITGATNLKWYFPDGTTSTATRPEKTLTEDGIVFAVCDDWSDSGISVESVATGANAVGDLSDFSKLTYYLYLLNANNITGDLKYISNISYYLNITGCSNVHGILNPVDTLTHVRLAGTNMSINDVDQSVINLEAITTVTTAGTLTLSGLQRSSVSTTAINSLIAKGWSVTDATVV